MSRHFLYISYTFPPFQAGGSIRSKNFCKNLPALGWTPHVLTVRQQNAEETEESLRSDLDLPAEVFIHRARSLDPLASKRTLKRSVREAKKTKLLQFASASLLVPDRQILWLPFALLEARKIIKKYDCQLILSTFGPASNHLLGYILKQTTQLPWIADYRDLWYDNKNLFFPTPLHKYLHRYLENKVLSTADHVITVGDHLTQTMLPRISKSIKTTTITNGYDAELIQQIQLEAKPPTDSKRIFRLVYAGAFYKNRNPDVFFKAVIELLENSKIRTDEIEITFLSNLRQDLAIHPLLDQVVKFKDLCSHRVALGMMNQADLLLLFIEPELSAQIVNAKLFDYFGLRKPILAFIDQSGPTAKYLQESGLGFIAEPTDVSGIAEKIHMLFEAFQKGQLQVSVNQAYIEQFDTRQLSRKLANILNQLG